MWGLYNSNEKGSLNSVLVLCGGKGNLAGHLSPWWLYMFPLAVAGHHQSITTFLSSFSDSSNLWLISGILNMTQILYTKLRFEEFMRSAHDDTVSKLVRIYTRFFSLWSLIFPYKTEVFIYFFLFSCIPLWDVCRRNIRVCKLTTGIVLSACRGCGWKFLGHIICFYS